MLNSSVETDGFGITALLYVSGLFMYLAFCRANIDYFPVIVSPEYLILFSKNGSMDTFCKWMHESYSFRKMCKIMSNLFLPKDSFRVCYSSLTLFLCSHSHSNTRTDAGRCRLVFQLVSVVGVLLYHHNLACCLTNDSPIRSFFAQLLVFYAPFVPFLSRF